MYFYSVCCDSSVESRKSVVSHDRLDVVLSVRVSYPFIVMAAEIDYKSQECMVPVNVTPLSLLSEGSYCKKCHILLYASKKYIHIGIKRKHLTLHLNQTITESIVGNRAKGRGRGRGLWQKKEAGSCGAAREETGVSRHLYIVHSSTAPDSVHR